MDAIITDPPYNISRENRFHTMSGRRGIDFGEWDKGFDQVTWLQNAIKLLKDGGSIIAFNSYENIGIMAKALRDNNVEVKCLIRWVKSNPFPRNVDRLYVANMEVALWGTKGKGWVFNKPKGKPYLTGEFVYPVVAGHEKTLHPTQKSVRLMRDIIGIHTNPNDTILDPFMGSGTTGVACQNLNRNFIGIEINPEYFKIAKERIERERVETLF